MGKINAYQTTETQNSGGFYISFMLFFKDSAIAYIIRLSMSW